ncbi:hemin uptake protein HemP [Mesorhizobium sangaii]|uniref:Hemin uptake protein HemP n=1 Tax=Mesorhizobium sangaii TaxID=505389 RepID=A0A841PYN2_9HYPH|nr:hemin uptake protein HemP [Mesorhizobium sangaii]MBB6413915.1 hemin uptake protein HemP [Mesorhizobium sangaii]
MRTLSSSTLGQHAIGIEHYGALYRLKITAGQLILNKQADQQGK